MYKTFVSPIKIIFGEDSIKEVRSIVESYKVKRLMILADPGVIEVGIVENLKEQLKGGGIEYKIYSNVVPELPLNSGNEALQTLKDYNAELVIGIGGGSTLDVAKAIAVLHNNEGKIEEYLNLSGTKKLKSKGLPKILIPTTSGTGAEVTDIAVFSLEDTKDVITHEYLLADVAIVDPKLTYSLPSRITAATGVDALTHALEAFVSVNATPLTETLSLEAIRKISTSLRTAVWNGTNEEARRNMAWGSLMAGLSFYNAGVAGVHALAYPLGGLFKIPHGEANAMLLPYIFDYIWPSCIDKMLIIANAFEISTEYLNKREVALEVVKELKNIISDVGIPVSLDAVGVKENDIMLLAENGIKQTRLLERSPMPFTLDDVKDCYMAALLGELKHEQ